MRCKFVKKERLKPGLKGFVRMWEVERLFICNSSVLETTRKFGKQSSPRADAFLRNSNGLSLMSLSYLLFSIMLGAV